MLFKKVQRQHFKPLTDLSRSLSKGFSFTFHWKSFEKWKQEIIFQLQSRCEKLFNKSWNPKHSRDVYENNVDCVRIVQSADADASSNVWWEIPTIFASFLFVHDFTTFLQKSPKIISRSWARTRSSAESCRLSTTLTARKDSFLRHIDWRCWRWLWPPAPGSGFQTGSASKRHGRGRSPRFSTTRTISTQSSGTWMAQTRATCPRGCPTTLSSWRIQCRSSCSAAPTFWNLLQLLGCGTMTM